MAVINAPLVLSRASSATLVDSVTGLLTEFGNNIPRFDTGLGLLIEGQRTNVLADARTPGRTGWTTLAITSAASAVGPNGVLGDATLVTEDTTNAQHTLLSGVATFTATLPYTISFLVKPGSCTNVQALGRSFAFGADAWLNFGLTGAGQIGTGGVAVTRSSIQKYGDWYWCSFTAPAANTGPNDAIALYTGRFTTDARSPTFTGTSRNVTIGPVWVEQGTFPTSPILPPAGLPAVTTRLADLTTTPLSSLGIGSNGACTVVATFTLPQIGPFSIYGFPNGFELNAGDINNRAWIYFNNGLAWLSRLNAAVNQQIQIGSGITPNSLCKVAFSGDGTGRFAASFNGGTVQNITGAPTSLSQFRVGSGFGGDQPINGYAQVTSILPYPVSDVTLPQFSTI